MSLQLILGGSGTGKSTRLYQMIVERSVQFPDEKTLLIVPEQKTMQAQKNIVIIKRAIEEPLREIVANAGKEGAVVVQKVREGKGDFGYNARTDVYENLHAAGVVDPAKVARVALENAASIAGMFLTTECVIVEKKEDKPEMPMGAPGMGGMGGMKQ